MRFLSVNDKVPVIWPGDEFLQNPRPCAAKVLSLKAHRQLVAECEGLEKASDEEWASKAEAAIKSVVIEYPDGDLALTPLAALELLWRCARAQMVNGSDAKKSELPSPPGTATDPQ